MSLAVTAVVSSAVAVAGLVYTIDSSNQAKRMASQREDAARIDAASALRGQQAAQKASDDTKQRNLDLSNERRRIGAPLAAITSGLPSGGSAGSSVAPAPAPGSAPSTSSSPATVTRGTGTLLGS